MRILMKGSDLKEWRKINGYKSQASLQLELNLGSRGTVSAWENSKENLPRVVVLALKALERCPDLRNVSGHLSSGAKHIQARKNAPNWED